MPVSFEIFREFDCGSILCGMSVSVKDQHSPTAADCCNGCTSLQSGDALHCQTECWHRKPSHLLMGLYFKIICVVSEGYDVCLITHWKIKFYLKQALTHKTSSLPIFVNISFDILNNIKKQSKQKTKNNNTLKQNIVLKLDYHNWLIHPLICDKNITARFVLLLTYGPKNVGLFSTIICLFDYLFLFLFKSCNHILKKNKIITCFCVLKPALD